MALYMAVYTFNSIFNQFINGVGKIRVNVLISVIVLILNIPLSRVLSGDLGLGVTGILIATPILGAAQGGDISLPVLVDHLQSAVMAFGQDEILSKFWLLIGLICASIFLGGVPVELVLCAILIFQLATLRQRELGISLILGSTFVWGI